jgi:hypothetical protein
MNCLFTKLDKNRRSCQLLRENLYMLHFITRKAIHELNSKCDIWTTWNIFNYYYYGSTALCWALADFSVSWPYTQSVGLLGRGMSPSQGRYLHTIQTSMLWVVPSVRASEDSSCLRPCGHCDRRNIFNIDSKQSSASNRRELTANVDIKFSFLTDKYYFKLFITKWEPCN